MPSIRDHDTHASVGRRPESKTHGRHVQQVDGGCVDSMMSHRTKRFVLALSLAGLVGCDPAEPTSAEASKAAPASPPASAERRAEASPPAEAAPPSRATPKEPQTAAGTTPEPCEVLRGYVKIEGETEQSTRAYLQEAKVTYSSVHGEIAATSDAFVTADSDANIAPPALPKSDPYHDDPDNQDLGMLAYESFDAQGRPLVAGRSNPLNMGKEGTELFQYLYFYECEDPVKACAAQWPLDDQADDTPVIRRSMVLLDAEEDDGPWTSGTVSLETNYPMPCNRQALVLVPGVAPTTVTFTRRSVLEGDEEAGFSFEADLADVAPFAAAMPKGWRAVDAVVISPPPKTNPALLPAKAAGKFGGKGKIKLVVDLDGDNAADLLFAGEADDDGGCEREYRRGGGPDWKLFDELCAD